MDLYKAVLNNDAPAVEELIRQGADVNALNSSIIKTATSENYVDILKLLIKAGANQDSLDEALISAFMSDGSETIKILMNSGSNINSTKIQELRSELPAVYESIMQFKEENDEEEIKDVERKEKADIPRYQSRWDAPPQYMYDKGAESGNLEDFLRREVPQINLAQFDRMAQKFKTDFGTLIGKAFDEYEQE